MCNVVNGSSVIDTAWPAGWPPGCEKPAHESPYVHNSRGCLQEIEESVWRKQRRIAGMGPDWCILLRRCLASNQGCYVPCLASWGRWVNGNSPAALPRYTSVNQVNGWIVSTWLENDHIKRRQFVLLLELFPTCPRASNPPVPHQLLAGIIDVTFQEKLIVSRPLWF